MSVWHHIIEVLLSWGPYGLLLLSTLDSVGLPIVGGVDALLIAIASSEPHQAYLAAVCAVAGSLGGSLILFRIARKGGEVLLEKHISRGTGARMHTWFQRYGMVTVFVPALSPLPLPVKIPVFCAGALNVRLSYFIFVVLSARTIRYATLAYLGKRYGSYTGRFLLGHGWTIGAIALGLAVVVAIGLRLYQRHRTAIGEPE
ncbi:MAG TPA: VTT domain-containing protein [Bryobacteraceae bacterium]|jgi:membrane protein YqaA with SNARE-associated domain